MPNPDQNHSLWSQLSELKSKYRWVDLTHELSAETPHWYGFQPLGVKKLFDFDVAPMKVYEYAVAGQYGTHADVPGHFDANGRLMEAIPVDECAYPLCVIDKSAEAAKNNDYALTKEDVLAWEAEHGQIPEGAFVAFRSDWSHRAPADYDNKDKDGNAHYPGWDLDCVKWLADVRRVGAIGHETPDTDPPACEKQTGFLAESYILKADKLNVELLKNLDQLPAAGAIVFVAFPKLKGGTGFPTRVFAICPK
ncbi:MAG: cyclase family protein [Synergistaceae bacterium]|jgi:kynurenine formamidase|nr:cyclase family protein [Synergistaceae bacterium]